jgi:hypothetical protein
MSPMRRARPLILLLLLLVPSAVAHARGTSVIQSLIQDCTDDEVLQGHYTQAELRSALASLSADADEYTNCRAVIRDAQLAGGSAGGGSTGSTPGSTPATGGAANPATSGSSPGAFGGFSGFPSDPASGASPTEKQALASAQIDPRAAQATELASSTLPTPVAIALGAIAVGLLITLALDLRRRVLARRQP